MRTTLASTAVFNQLSCCFPSLNWLIFVSMPACQIAWVTGMESTPVTMMMIGVRTILVLGYWALSSIHRYWVVLYDNCIGVQYCSDVLMTAVAST